MNRLHIRILVRVVLCSTALFAACDRTKPPSQSAPTAPTTPLPTNRVDVPPTVRRNLGMSFAKVERRPVAATIRVPGRFELLPDARREYRAMLSGRVELAVTQFQKVEPRQLLFRLDSPAWRELQQQLAATDAEIRQGQKRVEMVQPMREAHERRRKAAEETVALLMSRQDRLETARTSGSISAEEVGQVQIALAEVRAKLADVLEQEAKLTAQSVEASLQLQAARVHFDLLIDTAATVLDLDPSKLTDATDGNPDAPFWRTRDHIEVVAGAPGIVDVIRLTNGGWADETSLVLSTVQPERVRFRARAMQTDAGRFRDDQLARVVPPQSGSIPPQQSIDGEFKIGISADPDQRTIDLYLTPTTQSDWARPGVAGYLEVVAKGGTLELAIPLAAVIQDGLSRIIFRRDPANPDRVIRIADADLGIDDGRWVVINSGVRESDEVVLDGVYQLMVATSGSIQKGGHFHADGTFHEGDE